MKNIPFTTELERLVTEYQQHLLNDAGLTVSTGRVRVRHLRAFLTAQFKPKQALDLQQITPRILLDYVLEQRQRLCPESLQSVTGSLRSFCRFLCLSGRVTRDLSTAVPSVAAHQEHLPGFLSRREVDQLLEFLPGPNPAHKRDYAIVLCLARLGLRAGEVAGLTLEDIHWRTGTIRLIKTKGRRDRQLPLPAEVGRAIAEYLKDGRPRSSSRHVFVTLQDARPLSSNGVSSLTTRAMKQAGLVGSRLGPHLLRHTVASHLVQRGSSLKAVADLLGHVSLKTTQIYAKVNLPLLQQVAAPWPKEVRR
jgi:site-specific recombinase XerD